MSGSTEDPVHVDTPEQAEARQMVESNPRVTHVQDSDEILPGDTIDPGMFSLNVLTNEGKVVAVKGKVLSKGSVAAKESVVAKDRS